MLVLFLVFFRYLNVEMNVWVVIFDFGLKVKNWFCYWMVGDYVIFFDVWFVFFLDFERCFKDILRFGVRF